MSACLYLSRHLGRIGKRACFTSSLQSFVPVSTSAVRVSSETFFERNERLKRPLSPHLTIYKPQLTSILSVTHRATGIVLSGGLYGFAIGMLALPASFPYYFAYFQTLQIAAPVIFSLKFALAWNLFYHGANGVRHLFWDMGYGYDLKNLYLSGYLVLGFSLGASLIAAAM
ncbi:succinate dehydrogenase cytochrome b560 subunit, mitochondrial-like [Argiope bruennichi]|uniref:Succinate dehydrogenase cytochrome b560 like protein n=1 Tax=Argiope bruennichi TaxID=94029 RepID=A0A8T0E7M4_ARGBR|nr:succinate dehydrogenase cytochrome b560 subunit, mitochondrial-like [Argiope bruennichi]KAF8767378.1 Succinate dehydrogenase cytochrome b560 like protein [Argiope bruennichi]